MPQEDKQPVRRSSSWMQQLDERLLELIDEEGWTSSEVASSRPEFDGISRGRIQERLDALTNAGFVGPIFEGSDMYELDTPGQLYLKGRLNADHYSPARETRPFVPVRWIRIR